MIGSTICFTDVKLLRISKGATRMREMYSYEFGEIYSISSMSWILWRREHVSWVAQCLFCGIFVTKYQIIALEHGGKGWHSQISKTHNWATLHHDIEKDCHKTNRASLCLEWYSNKQSWSSNCGIQEEKQWNQMHEEPGKCLFPGCSEPSPSDL